MSEGLRAEDVKEALARVGEGDRTQKSVDILTLVAAAREWLAHSCVAALIAEGGEIEQAFEEPHYEGDTFAAVEVRGGPGRYLIYGPIPVESAEAKETPDSRDTGEKP